MSYSPTLKLINTDEYYRMGEVGILTEKDRVELIHGKILEMSPIGSKDAATVDRISNVLKEYLSKDAIVRIQNPVHISDLSEPQPDIAILKPVDHYYAQQHPRPEDILLIVEVADTSLAYDREVKIPLYASAGIPVYWLVNLIEQEIEVYHTPVENAYKHRELCRKDDAITFSAFNLAIRMDELLGF